jgi:putative NADPH-quinone reductase
MHAATVFNHPYDGSFCSSLVTAATRGLQKGGVERKAHALAAALSVPLEDGAGAQTLGAEALDDLARSQRRPT